MLWKLCLARFFWSIKNGPYFHIEFVHIFEGLFEWIKYPLFFDLVSKKVLWNLVNHVIVLLLYSLSFIFWEIYFIWFVFILFIGGFLFEFNWSWMNIYLSERTEIPLVSKQNKKKHLVTIWKKRLLLLREKIICLSLTYVIYQIKSCVVCVYAVYFINNYYLEKKREKIRFATIQVFYAVHTHTHSVYLYS